MKKKNSIILMFVVLITMFINVNKAQAVKLNSSDYCSCSYYIVQGKKISITYIKKDSKRVVISPRAECLIKLKGKVTAAQKKKCEKKSDTKSIDYVHNPRCGSGYSQLKFEQASFQTGSCCPKKLCLKKKGEETKEKTKEEKVSEKELKESKPSQTCVYKINGSEKSIAYDPDKNIFHTNAQVECLLKLNKKATDAQKKACDKKKGGVGTVKLLNSSNCGSGYNKYNLVKQNYQTTLGADCPEKLCIKESDILSEEKEKDATAKELKFSNTQGCAMWGSLLLTFKMIFTIVKWFMGVGLVILTMIDFAKAVMSSDPESELTKAKKKLTTRIIIFIILVIVPSILDLLISNILDVESCISEIQK